MTGEPWAAATSTLPVRVIELPGPQPRINGLVARRFDMARDLARAAELMSSVNLHDGVDWLPTEASLRHELEHTPGFDIARDFVVAEAGGALVGAVQVDWRDRAGRIFHNVQTWVRHDQRRLGLGRALLAWAEAHVTAGVAAGSMGPPDPPHVLAAWADLEIEGTSEFAAAAGYGVEGYGVMMTRPLDQTIPDAPLPDSIEVRPVRPDHHRAIWDADCEAFRDHRDPVTRTDADFERWFTMPELDTALWEVAWDGNEVAGSVWNMVFAEENERLGIRRGWLDHVSVRRPWRKRGLASALIVRSMRRFHDLGLTEAALGADAENLSGAVRLYESLGFRRVRTAAGYRKALELPAERS